MEEFMIDSISLTNCRAITKGTTVFQLCSASWNTNGYVLLNISKVRNEHLPDIPKMEGKNHLPEYGLYINGSVHRLIRSSPRFSISLGRVIKCNSNRCRCLVFVLMVAIFWIFPCSFLVGKIMYLQKGQVFTDIGF